MAWTMTLTRIARADDRIVVDVVISDGTVNYPRSGDFPGDSTITNIKDHFVNLGKTLKTADATTQTLLSYVDQSFEIK